VRETRQWRLSWVDGGDRRLTNYTRPVGGGVDGLAAVLEARLGRPVELQSLPS